MKKQRARSGWYSRLPVRNKLLLQIYTVLFVAILVSTVVSFTLQYRSEQSRIRLVCTRLTRVISQELQSAEQDVMDIGTYFIVNPKIRSVLEASGERCSNNTMVWAENTDLASLRDILAIKSQIKNVCLIPENGVTPFYLSGDSSVYNLDLDELHSSDLYGMAVENKGRYIYSYVQKGETFPYLRNTSDKLVTSRVLYDLSKKKKLGFLTISIDIADLAEKCTSLLQYGEETVVMMNAGGEIFLVLGDGSEGRVAEISAFTSRFEPDLTDAQKIAKGVTISGNIESWTWNGKNLYTFWTRNADTGMLVCNGVPKRVVLRNLMHSTTLFLPFLLMIIMLAALFPLSMRLSHTIAKPLETLSGSMQRVQEGDFHVQAPVTNQDEIGALTESFNKMVRDIDELIEKNYVIALKEKEMELDILQAQINPHFLYNALDSFYWQATAQGNDELADDILTLSKLFRLVLSQGETDIPIRREVELCECYLKIQKMRFGNRLNYSIRVEDSVMDMHISKMMLQPFVENAVVHGLESVDKGGVVTLTGRLEGHSVVFRILDNGCGMTEEEKARFLSMEEEPVGPDGRRHYGSEKVGHYAVRNVRERLKILYGDKYQLRVESEKGKGTMVLIVIPLEKEQQGG